MPVEPIFIELDHNLWNLQVCLSSRYKVLLLAPLPLDQEVELARLIGSSNNLLSLKVAGKAMSPLLLCLLGRNLHEVFYLVRFFLFSNAAFCFQVFLVGTGNLR